MSLEKSFLCPAWVGRWNFIVFDGQELRVVSRHRQLGGAVRRLAQLVAMLGERAGAYEIREVIPLGNGPSDTAMLEWLLDHQCASGSNPGPVCWYRDKGGGEWIMRSRDDVKQRMKEYYER